MIFRDGLGAREWRDTEAGERVEWLHLDAAFAGVETPLRERVARLAKLQHAKFARILSLEPAPKGAGPILVSSHHPGTRLSEVLEMAAHGLVTLEPGVALQITRDVLSALLILHDSRNVTHGALTPERLVLTTTGRVVVVEHALAAALERLNLPRHQLWRDWRIPTPPAPGQVRFDVRTDLAQLGLLSLAAILGRPIEDDEYPHRLRGLLPQAQDRLGRSAARSIAAEVVAWLERLVPVEGRRGFPNTKEAQQAFEALIPAGAAALGLAPGRVKALTAEVAALADTPASDLTSVATADATATMTVGTADEPGTTPGGAIAATSASHTPDIDIEALLRLEAELEDGVAADADRAPSPTSTPAGELPTPVPAPLAEQTFAPAPAPTEPAVPTAGPQAMHLPADLGELAQQRIDLERQFAELVAAVAPLEEAAATDPSPAPPPTVEEPLGEWELRWSPTPAASLAASPEAPEPETAATEALDASAGLPDQLLRLEPLGASAPLDVAPDPAADYVPTEWWRVALPWREELASVPGTPAALAGPAAEELAVSDTAFDAEPPQPDGDPQVLTAPPREEPCPQGEPQTMVRDQEATGDPAPEGLLQEADAAAALWITPLPLAAECDASAANCAGLGTQTSHAPTVDTAADVLVADGGHTQRSHPGSRGAHDAIASVSIVPTHADASADRDALALDVAACAPSADTGVNFPAAASHDRPAVLLPGEPVDMAPAVSHTGTEPAVMSLFPARAGLRLPQDGADAATADGVRSFGTTFAFTPADGTVNPATSLLLRADGEEASPGSTWRAALARGTTEASPAAADAPQDPAASEAVASIEDVSAEGCSSVDDAAAAPADADLPPRVTMAEGGTGADDVPPVGEAEHITFAALPEVVVVDAGPDGDALDALPWEQPSLQNAIAPAPTVASEVPSTCGEAEQDSRDDGSAGSPMTAPVAAPSKRKRRRARRKKAGTIEVVTIGRAASPEAGAADATEVRLHAAAPGTAAAAPMHMASARGTADAAPPELSPPGVRRSILDREVPTWTPPADLASMTRSHQPRQVSATPPSSPASDGGEFGAVTTGAAASRPSRQALGVPVDLRHERDVRAVGMPDVEEPGQAGARVPVTSVAATAGVAQHSTRASLESWSGREVPVAAPAGSWNWRRMAAASVLIALFQGAAFAAWWWVQPGAHGTLVVQAAQPGVEVLVDGKVVGKTPFRDTLPPGRHRLMLRHGLQVREMPVEISLGVVTTQSLDWPAADGSARGNLQVSSTPAGAEILIDGRSRGTAPQLIEGLPAGNLEMTLRGAAGTVTVTATVIAGETTSLEVPIFAGWVLVDAPIELSIALGGARIGSSTDGQILLSPGRHQLVAINEALGFRRSFGVLIEPGQVRRVTIPVPTGALQVQDEPGSEVFVDGDPAGTLPSPLRIPLGTHDVLVRRPDGTERRQTVTVRAGETASM